MHTNEYLHKHVHRPISNNCFIGLQKPQKFTNHMTTQYQIVWFNIITSLTMLSSNGSENATVMLPYDKE